MSSTAIEKELRLRSESSDSLGAKLGNRLKPRLGLKTRQIALITLFMSIVVMIITIANVAHLTNVIIKHTEDQAAQVSSQIVYRVQQEIAHDSPVYHFENPYEALASDHSGIQSMMESNIAVKGGPISYIYLADSSGNTIKNPDGNNELAANQHMISRTPSSLSSLADESVYKKLVSVFAGRKSYEYQQELATDPPVAGTLHVGVSSNYIRSELRSPIETDLLIGLLAIVGAAIVAISSANFLLRPLEAISSSIDRMSLGEGQAAIAEHPLPKDEVVSSVTARLRQLGERMAGDRSELEIMRGRLRQVMGHLEERLLLINREGRIILASPDAEQLINSGGHDLTGLPIDESLGSDHALVRLVERSFAERRPIVRNRIEVPYGQGTKWLLASVQYIEDAGEPVGALVSLRDFESFQKLESQWDLSKKLADLGRITSGIAHEVKNPLNAMVIHLEILRSKVESGAGNPKPQIEILDSEIKRLDRVVQTFLNFTRPMEIRLDPLDLNVLVDEVVTLANSEAGELGVTISFHWREAPLRIKGDADLLKQALLNIIINGCQAMPGGGPLRVATFSDGNGRVHITVADRGVGISPEARNRLFNLYYTTKKGGTGIGLAQAFRAVQLHNGKIEFESEPGHGTTFDIVLPVGE